MTASSRTLKHVGEWKVELRADSREELFSELARVIAAETGTHRRPTSADNWERVTVQADDLGALLVDWGNELIGRSEVAGRAYTQARDLTIEPEPATSGLTLAADVRGGGVDEWTSPLKAATYHGTEVEQVGSNWRAVVVFDV